MSRYIDAEKLKDLYQPINGKDYKVSMDILRLNIDDIPTADVQEIKHGKWDYYENPYGDYFRCSACGMDVVLEVGTPKDNHYQYCPSCGAKMDGE